MGGWGEERRSQVPPLGTGTTAQIELARDALAKVGIHADNLALAAIEAAGVIVRLREDWAEQAAVPMEAVPSLDSIGSP